MPDELISREAAIDALADYIHNVDKVMGTGHLTEDDCRDAAESVFEELPSAQPTQNERVNSNNPLDCISRQAAIDALGEKPLAWTDGEYELALQQQWESDVDAIKAVPSAQPKRKKGRWIGEPKDGIEAMFFNPKCSVCGFESAEVKNYCPMCGADMRGDADETD